MNSIALGLLIITVVVSLLSFNNDELLRKLLMWPYRIKRIPSEAYRMLTSGFIHADMLHLGFNMLTFYFFADILISKIGDINFLILYVSGIIVANLPDMLKYTDQPYRTGLGASGGVSAILFGAIYWFPWAELKLFFAIPIPAIIFAVLYVWFSYRMKDKDTRIGHEAHLWGAIYGFVYMLIIADASHGAAFINALKEIPYFKS